jgi:large subunit ribosomal protein L13
MMSTTTFAKPATVRADWFVVDAEGKTLGRLCVLISLLLQSKVDAVRSL